MFSTFTGNSKRPRNVNLSGHVGNPFANTSWTPAAVSSTTKTVSEAQADREKRQADRRRLKAAGNIQRTWRGHKARTAVADSRRAAFDDIYSSGAYDDVDQRLLYAFNLLCSFFSSRRTDDLPRLSRYVRDSEAANLQQITLDKTPLPRLRRLVNSLVKSLEATVSGHRQPTDVQHLLALVSRITTSVKSTISESVDQYYAVLAQLCQTQNGGSWPETLFRAVTAPLSAGPGNEEKAYKALAFHFLTGRNMSLFENNIGTFAQAIDMETLAGAIVTNYSTIPATQASRERLIWLLAHFIDLGRVSVDSSSNFIYLNTLLAQLSALSSEINVRIGTLHSSEGLVDASADPLAQSFDPYVARQLLSLVDSEGISKLLSDFAENLAQSSNQAFQGTSVLAGYILTLLQCFPNNADDARMRLFLELIPTESGQVPTVKFLWQIMLQTSVFYKLRTESETPAKVLRRYLQGASEVSNDTVEDQEWRIILLFLELYIFILRLSDDEDFFSGIHPQLLETNAATSRIRSCSLSLEDVKILSTFLKNTGFALHYKARDISQDRDIVESVSRSRLETYLSSSGPSEATPTTSTTPAVSTKLGLDSLRGIVTTALKMLYERDSRKPFLPADHWLMERKLHQEDFVTAVIAEEQRQNQEEEDAEDSDDEVMDSGLGGDVRFSSTMAGERVSRHARMERLRSQQMRAQRERRLAEMGPKLEILKHMPFIVPFETRVMIFRQFIHLDRFRRDGDSPYPIHPFARHHAKIHRGQLFEDAYKHFYELGEGLKDMIQITFVDQFDNPEPGIDGGGVTKEFLTSVTSEAFGDGDGGLGMFTSNEQGLLYPNPTAVDSLRQTMRQKGLSESDVEWRDNINSMLARFEFLGRIVGKCMYESTLVDLAFAGFFLLKWPSAGLNEQNSYKGSVNDLRDMDEELYKGMLRLKNYPGDVSDLGFDFTVTDQISPPGQPTKTVSRKLVPNGDEVGVTNDNRLLYISYVARHRLVVQPSLQTTAFLRGLRTIIRPSWLSMFNQSELQRLVGGDSSEIDIEDLRRNTIYSGLYEIGDDQREHPTIEFFWKVMRGFTDAQRRDVLKYVSSTPRAPLLGFSQLMPKFSIRDSGSDEDRLPSASTCVNLLKLPRYTRESTLREKLLYAVTSGAGFDLS